MIFISAITSPQLTELMLLMSKMRYQDTGLRWLWGEDQVPFLGYTQPFKKKNQNKTKQKKKPPHSSVHWSGDTPVRTFRLLVYPQASPWTPHQVESYSFLPVSWKKELCQEGKHDTRRLYTLYSTLAFAVKTHKTLWCPASRPCVGAHVHYLLLSHLVGEWTGPIRLLACPSQKPVQ